MEADKRLSEHFACRSRFGVFYIAHMRKNARNRPVKTASPPQAAVSGNGKSLDARIRRKKNPDDAAAPSIRTDAKKGETESLLDRIRRLSPTLSDGQRKVLDFFLRQPDEAVFFTSIQVARATAVSEATVSRTARAVGFDGYPEFKSAFQAYFLQRMSTVARVKLTAKPNRKESEIIDELLEAELANLKATHQALDHDAIGRAAALLGEAQQVYVIGLRSGYGMAWLLDFSLNLMGGRSRLVTPGFGNIPEQLEQVRPGDVVFGIGFERYTRATVELFRACLAKGARGIALTDKATSPLVEGADVVLEAQTRLSSFVESFVAPTAVIDTLLTLVATRHRRRVLKALAVREADWLRHGTYM